MGRNDAPRYRLKFVPSALHEWRQLDGSIQSLFVTLLRKRLQQPHVPGSELRGTLRCYYKLRLRKQGYRLVYGVNDDEIVVIVISVGRRSDSEVYEAAVRALKR